MVADAGLAVAVSRGAASGVKVTAEVLSAEDEESLAAEPALECVVSPQSNVGDFLSVAEHTGAQAAATKRVTPVDDDGTNAPSSSAGGWHGVRPLGVTRPLSAEVKAHQAESLRKAWTMLATMGLGDVVTRLAGEEAAAAATRNAASAAAAASKDKGKEGDTIAVRTTACGCSVEVDFAFPDTWNATIVQRLRRVPVGLLTAAALFHEADLIRLPRWPKLPHIEGIGVLHRFEDNELLLNPVVEPWGPFPGADSIHAVVLFGLSQPGHVLVWAESPPEGASSYRGVSVAPPRRKHKRNILNGAVWLVRPCEGSGEGGSDCSGGDDSDGGGGVGGGEGSGLVDIDVFLQAKLPIPSWLIPPPLVRWATGPFASKLIPLVRGLGDGLGADDSEIGQRVREDGTGWYAALRRWLGDVK